MTTPRQLTASHWGVYEIVRDAGRATGLRPFSGDPDPSPIGLAMLEAYRDGPRIRRPAIRKGWLEHGPGSTDGRGREPFVEVSWDEAARLVARELRRVIDAHGNEAIFGGSYGWSSAGRFHHAQSQLRRFMNMMGGSVQHADSYSLGAGRVVIPHVVGQGLDELLINHTSWQVLARHTRLFVTFGGVPWKNGQIMPGGPTAHIQKQGLADLAAAGCKFVNFSIVRSDLEIVGADCEWIPIRPNTDTAVMLGLATEIVRAQRHDREFLEKYCVGFERWERYLLGGDDGVAKDAEWASRISGVDADRLRALALDMAREVTGKRTMVNVAWSLQRSDHGEQPFWAVIALAAVIGQIGVPGGGFGMGYGPVNVIGSHHRMIPGPRLPAARNPVKSFIPVARITDMLLAPGTQFDYNGQRLTYPDIRLVYWVGGNPWHHHQDLNRLLRAWRKPETIVVHEQVWNAHAKHADIVLPATSTTEREDISYAYRDLHLTAMSEIDPPPGEARDDYAIFAAIARHLGKDREFTEGRTPREWLEHLWEDWRGKLRSGGVEPPEFARFWADGLWQVPQEDKDVVLLSGYRADPQRNKLGTPSGRIEIFSERVASFGYDDCPGYPAWLEPAEWLGSPLAGHFPLHLISDQPVTRLHSQLDFSPHSRARKVAGREPIWVNPDDALARGIQDGDVVRVFNDRGACLAGAVVTDAIRPGVVKLSTGSWWDPAEPGVQGSTCRHGNPNVLTRDAGASRLSQGCAAQTCLVEIAVESDPPAAEPFRLPEFVKRP